MYKIIDRKDCHIVSNKYYLIAIVYAYQMCAHKIKPSENSSLK